MQTRAYSRPTSLHVPGTVLLDTARPDRENREGLLFTEPRAVLTAATLHEVPGVLEAVQAAADEGHHVAGYLSYEAGACFEARAPVRAVPDGPLAWFGVYGAPVRLAAPDVSQLLDAAAAESYAVRGGHFLLAPEAYAERVEAIKAYIREGDVYQVNFTGTYAFDFEGSPVALYRALRRRQQVAYGALIHTGSGQVLSLSPELFFRREGERLTARPMKGTVRRGATHLEDAAVRDWLVRDEKNRAENLMIVDLLRNDLSRICRPGTVRVPALFAAEAYETLFQMTSTVEGQLMADVSYEMLFRALFPCGSVTGAPKLRAMELIHLLEPAPRGVYCGAIGYVAPDRQAVFNVAIRTLVLRAGRGAMGIGSGIVWDSDPAAEYAECLLKARFFTGA